MNMADFLVNVLSASDLTTYRFRTEQELPEKGQREYQPSNSWLETEQLKTALEERLQLVAEERVSRLGTLARANWDDQIKEALVTRVVGRHWQLFGHERRTRIWLYPEEALFLVECGCLELMHNGVAMSIQQAYCTLLSPNTNRTLNEYRTYSHLLRHGYRVLRHTPCMKSVSSDSHVEQTSKQMRGVVEVMDISDIKPGSSPSHSNAGTSVNPVVHTKKEPSVPMKTTFLNPRTKTTCAVDVKENTSLKSVSKVPTDEADVTLVYEQKGPVMQSCLKPKGSLVLFPDSQFESQSSSRTGNVTPIDIDDNELEISYVNKNVSVTLSPQKKEKHDFETSTLEIVPHKDIAAEVLSTNTIKESPSNKIVDEFEEQSVTVEACTSKEGSLQSDSLVLMQESVIGRKDADALHTSDISSDSVLADERNAQDNKASKEMLEDVIMPVESTESELLVGAENEKLLSSVNGVSHSDFVTEERSSDCSSTVTIQTENSVASVKVLKTNLNVQETFTSENLLVTNTNGSVVSEDHAIDNIPLRDLDAVESNGHVGTSLVKSEAGDVIEVQENDCKLHMKTVDSPTISEMEIDTNSKEMKSEWPPVTPKKENADIEIICVESHPNFSKNVKKKGTDSNFNQGANTNYFNNKCETVANSSWKQSVSATCVKPDVEIVFLEEEPSSTAGVRGDIHQNKTRKRSLDLDLKEFPRAKKQLVNSNWLCSSETETKPSSSEDINVINLDDDEFRLTLAEKKAVLDAIPSVENKFTIHVRTPKEELLPPNIKPKQKDYYVQLWRLKADGFGGGPARSASNPTNNFPLSQQIRQHHVHSNDTQRINPWLPVPLIRQHQPPLPLLGLGTGLLPHPMFAQAVMMAQSLAMAQSFAMNFNYHRGHQRFHRGRYLHRPYFRRGFKRRYNGNNRHEPYHRYGGQGNTSRHFSRNTPHSDESSDSQSRSHSTTHPPCTAKLSDDKKLHVVIDIDDDSNEKLGRTGDSDDEVLECYEVTPSSHGSSRNRNARTRGRQPGNRYFAPSRKFREATEKMWHDERNDVEEISTIGTVDRYSSHLVKNERKSIEVTLSSDDELMDDSVSEEGRGLLDVVDEDNMELVPCLQPENCKNVDTILSRLQIFQQGKKPRNMVSTLGRKQLRVTFDLYLPSMSFRKATPGIPDYRIIVFSQEHSISSYEQSMPTLGDISWALKDFDDSVPLLLARVDSDTIQFTLLARIDLPVAPGIACDVL